MTTDTVNADDLAAALREAVNASRAHVTWWQHYPSISLGIKHQVDGWQSLLDRFDAQRREGLMEEISDAMTDRDWHIRSARLCASEAAIGEYAWQARAANHRILHLRRQLRALGGEA